MPRDEFVSNRDVKHVGLKQRYSNEVCISVAWDWIFQGHSARGMMEEVGVSLESAVANHRGAEKRHVYSLGKTETCTIGALRAALAMESQVQEANTEVFDIEDMIARNTGIVFESNYEKGGKSGARYAQYKVAKTCLEAIQLGATKNDLRWDLIKGIAKANGESRKIKKVPICWNKSWTSHEDEKRKDEDMHLDREEAKRILQGLGQVVLDHIAKPYDEYDTVRQLLEIALENAKRARTESHAHVPLNTHTHTMSTGTSKGAETRGGRGSTSSEQ